MFKCKLICEWNMTFGSLQGPHVNCHALPVLLCPVGMLSQIGNELKQPQQWHLPSTARPASKLYIQVVRAGPNP